MPNRHTTFYISDITPIDVCGKTLMWQINLDGAFELPFEVDPTLGEHDFNTCSVCQNTLKRITDNLTIRYQGKEQKKGFPNCCPNHARLVNYTEFTRSRDYFLGVPEMTARKVVYTNQHIKNNHDREDWYKEITDYIAWVVESFGQMPKDAGEPLYLSTYFSCVKELLDGKGMKDIDKGKRNKIENFINSYLSKSKESAIDFSYLIKTYERWINIFPFQLKAYFGNLREHFENQLPIFKGEEEYNSYSGKVKIAPHTLDSLLWRLNELTKTLLNTIDIQKLIDDRMITDINRHKFELETSELRLKTNNLTLDLLTGEQQYVKILNQWLSLHKTYFHNITPLLSTEMGVQNPNNRILDP